MNVKGLDYNTERKKLTISEYGRHIHKMVDYCKSLPTKEERTACAHNIVSVMDVMNPYLRLTADYKQKLWNHLAIISNFELDIDYPFPVTKREDFMKRPSPLKYPMQNIVVRHYGHLLEDLFNILKKMPDGEERDALVERTANQMKRSLHTWNFGGNDDEKVANDLARFTDGKIQLDLNNFRFEKIVTSPQQKQKKSRKK